jgi:hypothetical protein
MPSAPAAKVLAHRYGLAIPNDWIGELERTHGVKL